MKKLINDLFNDIVENDYSAIDLQNILNEYTSFDLKSMEYLLCDVESYLFVNDIDFLDKINHEEGWVDLSKFNGLYRIRNMMKEEINKPQQTENTKTKTEEKKEFKDFFTKIVNEELIIEIKEEYKSYNGKRMAYLIFILHNEFKLIDYSLKGKNNSRKHFTESLIGKKINMQGINKYFETHSLKLKSIDYQNDNDYKTIYKNISNKHK